MGFVLSIIYFVTYYLTPAYLFGSLADAHVQVIIAALIAVVSLPALMKSFILKSPQTLALIGLALAVTLSAVIGRHYLTGGLNGFLNFIPNGMAFFIVCLHCTTKKKMQILVLTLLSVCLLVIAHGYLDLRHGVAESGPPPGTGFGDAPAPGATASQYLERQTNGTGEWIYRVQGLGEINDPNDFGQLIVCTVPLMFIFWRPKKLALNLLLVIFPVCLLLIGLFLTHSRGGLVALTLIAVVAARRRIGTVPAAVLACVLFLAAMALQFTGGRDISASAGEDRTSLWGEGMETFKSHPFFGIGYGHLWEYTEGYLTAHNSIVVCAAELGIFGFYFWSLFLFPTLRDALVIASPQKVNEPEPVIAEEDPFPRPVRSIENLDKDEINRLGRLVLLALVGFLSAGWFLSRAFVVTLFLLGGLSEVVYQMALKRGMVAPRLPFSRVLVYSGGLAILLITSMYTLVRVVNLTH